MWDLLFVITTVVSICLGVAAFLMRDRSAMQSQIMSLSSDNSSFRTISARPNLVMQLAEPEGRMVMRADRRLYNLSEMITRLRLDFVDLNIGSALHTCQTCPAAEVCNGWLVRASKSFKRAPAFCPNARRFSHASQVLA